MLLIVKMVTLQLELAVAWNGTMHGTTVLLQKIILRVPLIVKNSKLL